MMRCVYLKKQTFCLVEKCASFFSHAALWKAEGRHEWCDFFMQDDVLEGSTAEEDKVVPCLIILFRLLPSVRFFHAFVCIIEKIHMD